MAGKKAPLPDHRSADILPGDIATPDVIKERLFRGPWTGVLSRSRIIENIYMVAVGIRRSSMFHPVNIEEMINVRLAVESTGLGLIARKAGERVYKMFIFSRDRAEMASLIPDMDESMGDREFIVAQITMANFTGAFLDFPKCCIDDFVSHLMKATDQDKKAREQLLASETPDPRAYFVERFVPCSPDCGNAIREGERIERELSVLDADILKEYLDLRDDHMLDVREGRIVKEKMERDRSLSG